MIRKIKWMQLDYVIRKPMRWSFISSIDNKRAKIVILRYKESKLLDITTIVFCSSSMAISLNFQPFHTKIRQLLTILYEASINFPFS